MVGGVLYSHNDFVDNFSEGLAIYKTMGKWGVIDKNAREIIHPYYDYMHKFSQGLAAIKFNNKWGFVDRNANELIKPIYSWVSPNGFKENLVAVNLGGNKNSLFFEGGRWGFVNLSGEKVIAIKYDFVGDFNNGLALVNLGGSKNGYGFLSGGKNGFIDKNGREIINLYYDEAKNFKDNKALVKKNERWYILKKIYN